MSQEDAKNEYIEQITQAVPTPFPEKKFLVSLARMDLRFFDSPIFTDPEQLKKLMDTIPPFDVETLQSAWNLALCDSDYEFSSVAKKLVLNSQEEKNIFLQFNYCRLQISSIFKEAKRDRLTISQAQEAVKWGKEMKRCRDTLIIANLGLVFSMGRKYSIFSGSDCTELMTEGFGAVMRAVDGFNISRGFKFSTYACRAIIQAMNRTKAKIAKRLQKEFPSSLDITPESKIDHQNYSVEEDLAELRSILSDNKADLNENELVVITERFLGENKKTLEEVGLTLDLTKERVRQIQNKALEKLKVCLVN